MPEQTPPNLILGAVEGMTWQALRPFVLSLRRTGFGGELVLFVAGIDRTTREWLVSNGAQVHPMPRAQIRLGGRSLQPYDLVFKRLHTHYPTLIRQTSRLFADPKAATRRLAAFVSVRDTRRFLVYLGYLSQNHASYGNVMLTDIRDVFFQADPFQADLHGELQSFLEDSGETLATQPHNRKWLEAAFGAEVVHELGGKPIVCAGVTIGPAQLIRRYLEVMADFLLGLPRQGVGLDQAVHNYVLHKGLVPGAHLIPNGAGLVSTLGIVPEARLSELLSSAVLHQYDRHPALAARLLDSLGPIDPDPFQPSRVDTT